MSRCRVRLTLEALADLKRLQAFLIENDAVAAARAVDAIETSLELLAYAKNVQEHLAADQLQVLRALVQSDAA